MQRRSVVLPAPLDPTSATISSGADPQADPGERPELSVGRVEVLDLKHATGSPRSLRFRSRPR